MSPTTLCGTQRVILGLEEGLWQDIWRSLRLSLGHQDVSRSGEAVPNHGRASGSGQGGTNKSDKIAGVHARVSESDRGLGAIENGKTENGIVDQPRYSKVSGIWTPNAF